LIRFSWTTNNSGSINPDDWHTYGWYIDDVKIVTNADNDISVESNYWGSDGLNYYMIPTTQVAPIDFSANVFNGGANDQAEVQLNVDVNGGAFTGSSATGTTIVSGASDSLFLTTPYTPAAVVGNHAVTRTISQTATDDVPANNMLSNISFDVTEFVYARDNNVADGTESNSGLAFESGSYFDIWQDQEIKGIDVLLSNTTNVGTFIYGKIYEIDATTGDFVEVAATDYYEVTSQDLNGTTTLELFSPFMMLNSTLTYLVTVGTDGDGGASNDLVIKTGGTSDVQTSFFKDEAGTWFYTTSTPMVRLNFDPTVSLNENNLEWCFYFP